jgi:hypothetical protein
MIQKRIRSTELNSITSYGMISVINAIKNFPSKPFSLIELAAELKLRRNDIINNRRQLIKISNKKGAIRFIEPDRTHIVFISDDVTEETKVTSILAAASAVVHMNKESGNSRTMPLADLQQFIYEQLSYKGKKLC